MNKKLLVVALACMAVAFTGSAFAQASECANGATLQAVIVGSSAQFNTFAYSAIDLINSSTGLNTGPANLFSVKGVTTAGFYTAAIQDIRAGAFNALDSASLWVIWDTPTGSNACNVFAYYSVDSTVGNRAFFAATDYVVSSKTYSGAGVWPCLNGQTAAPCNNTDASLSTSGFCTGKCSQNLVGGLSDTNAAPNDILPTTVFTELSSPVTPTSTGVPPAYCGQLGAAGSTSNFWCYFNAAGTDIRPEDAFWATQRLIVNAVASGMTGLDYNNSNCTIGSGGPGSQTASCQIYDSFGQKGTFNALKFNITGKDPYVAAATVPGYTTLSVGASPVLVGVANADTSGFGKTYTDVNSKTVYLFDNILRKKLAFIFEGSTYCTGDILPGAPLACEGTDSKGNSIPYGCGYGSGAALQVVHREPLSGTYNTFEFTGVRSMTGSYNSATSKLSTTAWTSDDEGGQEMWAAAASGDVTNAAAYPYFIDPGSTSMGWSAGALASACGGNIASFGGINIAGVPTGTQNCADPLFISGANLSKKPNCASGNYLRLRAIGTGQEVPDLLGLNNSGAAVVSDGIGYAFWSYGNWAKSWASNAPVGHYLTVDHIDPLFATAGGYYDRTDGQNPNTFPNCDSGTSSKITLPCTNTIPFAHIYDGTYPLWSLLRLVTFPATSGKTKLPPFVLDLLAQNEQEVNDSTHNINDFVPFLTNLKNTGTLSAPAWTGDLNLGVFRVHYKEGTGAASVNPANGHAQCAGVFSAVKIQGGTSHSAACLVDTGSDVGGSVMTVQDDIDFNVDFGSTTTEGVALGANYEEYGLRQ